MLRGLILVFILGMLSLATPAQAARELVCEGYGHTAQPGNLRLLVDCSNMGKVREALENAYRDISRLGRQQHLTDLCARGVSEARRANDMLAGPQFSTSMLMFCNPGYQYLPLAHEEVLTDLYRRYRVDNINWQPFFLELLDFVPEAKGGSCQFRIVRQPLTQGLDAKEVATGQARYDNQRISLTLDWHTRETNNSRRPEMARLAIDDMGRLSGEMKVFHLWGEEHRGGTLVDIAITDFGPGMLEGRMFSAPVDEHWSMDIRFENCADNKVETVEVNRDDFSGSWGRACPFVFTLNFVSPTALRRSISDGKTNFDTDFRYTIIQSEVLHQPTQTKLLPGDILTFKPDPGAEEGIVWRQAGGTLIQVLYYMNQPGSERIADAGFRRSDGLQFANGESVGDPIGPLKRISCS